MRQILAVLRAADAQPGDIRELLSYAPDAGELVWKERPSLMFSHDKWMRRWNTRYAGKVAFTATNGSGYKSGAIHGRHYVAHRVAWAIFYGEWPHDQIDHINGDRSDNRIGNLRIATQAENCRNMGIRSDNSSGALGVRWRKDRNRWIASITVDGKSRQVGAFTDKSRAIEARAVALGKYGYHENHGSHRTFY